VFKHDEAGLDVAAGSVMEKGYGWAVPLADELYDEYLWELGEEGLI
jgi:hypothetical protein